eukprot:TRINITY_DN18239_c0_g8_i1.p1 TRINITY_DN18239_c0_g8~~TRINITY_DN18239_c0_g8_i1.p1  ORF type:complete len:467 (-),score=123.13 TRINITY_DN18239_c0_g8_i1:41-1441(-)
MSEFDLQEIHGSDLFSSGRRLRGARASAPPATLRGSGVFAAEDASARRLRGVAASLSPRLLGGQLLEGDACSDGDGCGTSRAEIFGKASRLRGAPSDGAEAQRPHELWQPASPRRLRGPGLLREVQRDGDPAPRRLLRGASEPPPKLHGAVHVLDFARDERPLSARAAAPWPRWWRPREPAAPVVQLLGERVPSSPSASSLAADARSDTRDALQASEKLDHAASPRDLAPAAGLPQQANPASRDPASRRHPAAAASRPGPSARAAALAAAQAAATGGDRTRRLLPADVRVALATPLATVQELPWSFAKAKQKPGSAGLGSFVPWRSLAESLRDRVPALHAEALAVLAAFVAEAEAEERAFDAKLAAEEEAASATLVPKFGPRVLDARRKLEACVRRQDYREAARLRDDIRRMEQEEMRRYEELLRQRRAKLMVAGRARAQIATEALQRELSERLWERIYLGELPTP